MDEPNYAADRAAAIAWARDVLAGDFLVLDSETTGLGIWDQIIQIAIVDQAGDVLFDERIKPTRPIDPAASRVHGIYDEDLVDCPTFAGLRQRIVEAIAGRRVVIYNADFDVGMLAQSDQLYQVDADPAWQPGNADYWRQLARFEDAMRQYAAYTGDWSDWHGDYRYQKLPGGDHSALGDARATLRLLKRMAGVPNAQVVVPAMDHELRAYESAYGRIVIGDMFAGRSYYPTPIEDTLAAFVADLMASYGRRGGGIARERLAYDWFKAYHDDLRASKQAIESAAAERSKLAQDDAP